MIMYTYNEVKITTKDIRKGITKGIKKGITKGITLYIPYIYPIYTLYIHNYPIYIMECQSNIEVMRYTLYPIDVMM